jgi:hydrogenase maturation protease HycI
LKTALPTKTAPNPRVVVMGIGSDLRGDDAAGPAVVRALASQLGDSHDHVRLIDAGAGPENFTGPVRRFDPALVILVDAALMGDAPGAVQWLAWEDTVGLSASTHTLPPYLLAKYLTGETGCTVAVIGIQPSGNGLGDPLSPPVAAAVEAVSAALAAALA